MNYGMPTAIPMLFNVAETLIAIVVFLLLAIFSWIINGTLNFLVSNRGHSQRLKPWRHSTNDGAGMSCAANMVILFSMSAAINSVWIIYNRLQTGDEVAVYAYAPVGAIAAVLALGFVAQLYYGSIWNTVGSDDGFGKRLTWPSTAIQARGFSVWTALFIVLLALTTSAVVAHG